MSIVPFASRLRHFDEPCKKTNRRFASETKNGFRVQRCKTPSSRERNIYIDEKSSCNNGFGLGSAGRSKML